MTDIHDLAQYTAGAVGVTPEAAEEALEGYIRQIETLESRPIDRDDINRDDAGFLTESVRQAQRAGDLGSRELARLEECAADMDHAADALSHATEGRDNALRDALRAGARIKDIMSVTGLSRARVDQIRRS